MGTGVSDVKSTGLCSNSLAGGSHGYRWKAIIGSLAAVFLYSRGRKGLEASEGVPARSL